MPLPRDFRVDGIILRQPVMMARKVNELAAAILEIQERLDELTEAQKKEMNLKPEKNKKVK